MKSEAGQKELVKIANVHRIANAELEKKRAEADGNNQPPKQEEEITFSRAGTTCTVVLVTEDKIICANAGDSRTVYGTGWVTMDQDKPGKGIPLSEDHKP